MHRLLERAAGLGIAQFWRLTLQRRPQPHHIAVAQVNGTNAPIAMEQAVGGVEVLEAEVAVAGALALEDGVHPAEARILQGQLTAGVAAQAYPLLAEGQGGHPLAAGPKFHQGLALRERPPGGTDPSGALGPGPLQGGPGQLHPGLAHRDGRQAGQERIEARGDAQAGAAARP